MELSGWKLFAPYAVLGLVVVYGLATDSLLVFTLGFALGGFVLFLLGYRHYVQKLEEEPPLDARLDE